MSDTPRSGLLARVGKLYKVLDAAFPGYRSTQDVLAIPRLADDLGYAHETLYKCVRKDTMRVNVALNILKFHRESKASPVPLLWSDLLPFVLPEFEEFSAPPST